MNNLKLLHLKLTILISGIILLAVQATAQKGNQITGEIFNNAKSETIPFANVALFDSTGTRLIGGAAANTAGVFNIENVEPGNYLIQVSALGFETFTKQVKMTEENINLDSILLSNNILNLQHVDVVANRIRGRSATDKTIFYIGPKMQESSNTGTDIVKLIPGIQVDLQQNISIQGNRNIIILVNGKERDRSYLSQLPANKVDKVEVMTTPPSKYDASVSGVINIILVHEENTGFDGQIYLELPSSNNEIYLQPAYSFNYGFGNFNLFTSYNGDLRYFDISKIYHRQLFNNPVLSEIIYLQNPRQKTWSHRFHYGFDWFLNDRNQMNFYAYYNPYSQELDGNIEIKTTGVNIEKETLYQEDNDENNSSFYSLWYKHLFRETTDHNLTIEISWQKLNAKNISTLNNPVSGIFYENNQQPLNHSTNVKLDYTVPAGKKIKLNTGFQTRIRTLKDRNFESFRYNENTFAGFAAFNYTSTKLEMNLGLRTEHWEASPYNQINRNSFFLLPIAFLKYNLNDSQNLKFSWRKSLSYPGFYQLNPLASTVDMFTVNYGNATLEPEIHNQLNLEYAVTLKNHFLSAQLFRRETSGAIRNLVTLNENNIMETHKMNLGEIRQTGIILNSSLTFRKGGLNPYLKIADVYSIPGASFEKYGIQKRHMLAVESALSAYISLKKGFSASANVQYNSPLNEIQGTSFSDALYFLSLDKSFSKGLKAGVICGLPFRKNFTFQGYEVTTSDFSNRFEGIIHFSTVPLWFKISYRFSSGKHRKKTERTITVPELENRT